jgi:peptidoglycan hydrolase CwlO-like protein
MGGNKSVLVISKTLSIFDKIIKDLNKGLLLCEKEVQEIDTEIVRVQEKRKEIIDASDKAKKAIHKLEEIVG